MFTLSSAPIFFITTFLPWYGESFIPTLNKSTLRSLNAYHLPKDLLGNVMSPASLRKSTR